MKSTVNDLDITPILDFFLISEVAIIWQTDSTAHKLKPRLFHKFAHLRVHPVDFHSSVNRTCHIIIITLVTK